MTNQAQDEYNRLIRSSTQSRPTHHRHDSSSSASSTTDLSDSQTHPQPTFRPSKSIRSRTTTQRTLARSFDSDDSDSESSPAQSTRQNGKPNASTNLPSSTRLNAANTGVKGVITDAWAAEHAQRDAKYGVSGVAVGRNDGVVVEHGGVGAGAWGKGAGYVRESEDDGEGDGEVEDADEEYMQQWRERRRMELSGAGTQRRGEEREMRRWSSMERVDALGYLDAVEGTDSGTVVVVFIADDDSSLSDLYTTHLTHLSHKHTHTRFLSLSHIDAEIDEAGVPALLAYRGGKQIAAVVPLVDEVRVTCNVVVNLEACLKDWGMV